MLTDTRELTSEFSVGQALVLRWRAAMNDCPDKFPMFVRALKGGATDDVDMDVMNSLNAHHLLEPTSCLKCTPDKIPFRTYAKEVILQCVQGDGAAMTIADYPVPE